jgi:glutamate/tyrosine decarboxylase-like PLP-dependent enzyme
MSNLELSRTELLSLTDHTADLAKRYWCSLNDRRAYPETSSNITAKLFSVPWTDEGRRNILDEFNTIAEHSRPATGRFYGYIFGSGEPVGALGEFLAAVLNQNATSWRSAPAAITIERAVVGWLAEAIGCHGYSGSLCGGGSAANLMGLAMAREANAPANQEGAQPCIVYASEQVHLSIPKAVALLGIGKKNLRLVPVDDHFQMRPEALDAAIVSDRRAGQKPIAVVASVGTVMTGAIDPLPALSAIAEREGLWLHVDGAYGVLAALAAPERVPGLALADSLSLDPHKWLYQPPDCGCLLYRSPQAARAAFSHTDDYVKRFTDDPLEAFAFFDESIELTRRFRALKLWLSLSFHGRQAFREAIACDLRHAQLLAAGIQKTPELELLAPVSLSAVCFRHRSKDNQAILRQVNSRGRVYLSNATIKGQFSLRACFVNHRTKTEDVDTIISECLAAASEVN